MYNLQCIMYNFNKDTRGNDYNINERDESQL